MFSGPVRRAITVYLGLITLLSGATAHAFDVELSRVSNTSVWREFNDAGALLVRESGHLTGFRATVATPAGGDWGVALMARHVTGGRTYLGQSSSGQPVQSDAGVRERVLDATGSRRLWGGWSATAGWQGTRLGRDLRGTAQAAGYPESWGWDAASVGLNWQRPFDRVQLRMHGRVGAVVSSRMTVTFPGRDATDLRPAHGRNAGLGVDCLWTLTDGAPTYAVVMSLNREMTRFQASSSAPVNSSGVLRGVARQPATTMAVTGLMLGLQVGW